MTIQAIVEKLTPRAHPHVGFTEVILKNPFTHMGKERDLTKTIIDGYLRLLVPTDSLSLIVGDRVTISIKDNALLCRTPQEIEDDKKWQFTETI